MGERVVTILAILGGLALAALAIAELPPVSWMNDLQLWMFGWYSMRLTFVFLFLVVGLPAWGLIAAIKAAREASEADKIAQVAQKLNRRPFEEREQP